MNKEIFSSLTTFCVIVLSVFLFANCEQSDNKNSLPAEQSETKNHKMEEQSATEFSLESLFFYSIDELREKFGSSNVRNEFNEACETCGPEGTPSYENSYVTTLFPNSSKEVIIDWNSDQTSVTEVTVSLNGKSWKTKEGFRVGDSIAKINRYFKNNPVKLLYANWFYYQMNDYCTLMFNSEDLDFENLDMENLISVDSRLKNLVLVAISIRIPGHE